MRVIITGGTGLIGQTLTHELANNGYEVVVVSRNPRQTGPVPPTVSFERWDARTAQGWGHLIDGADAVVNLAGASIAGEGFFPARWTDERKKLILDSRVHAGQAVVEAVKAAKVKPKVVIQSSGIDHYPPDEKNDVAEDGPTGNTFLAHVTVKWEASTAPVEEMGVRRAVIRSAVVLSFKAGALQRMALPFKLFVGGPMGSGRQPFCWIHPVDEARAIRFLIENSKASGVFNLAAPNILTNAEFSRILGRVMERPSFIPVPGFAFKLAFGEVASLVLEGRRAVPKRLLEMGFDFVYPEAEAALNDLYHSDR